MAAEWYLKIAEQEVGPLTAQQLKEMAEKGQLGPESPVRRGETGRWVSAKQVRGLMGNSATADDTEEATIADVPMAKRLKNAPEKASVEVSAQKKRKKAVPMAKRVEEPPAPPALETPSGAEAQPPVPPVPPAQATAPQVQAAVPVGTPATPAPTAVPQGTPVAGPASPGNSPSGFAIAAENPTTRGKSRRSSAAAGAPEGRKKKRNQTALIVGAIVVVAGLVGVGIWWMTTGDKPADSGRGNSGESGQAAGSNGGGEQTPRADLAELGLEGLSDSPGVASSGAGTTDSPEDGSPAAPTTPATTTSEWRNPASGPVRIGEVSVKITAVEVGRPRLVRANGQRARPPGEYLVIRMELLSTNAKKKFDYVSWNLRSVGVELTDDANNPYKIKTAFRDARGMAHVEGQVTESTSIRPESPTVDAIVFEPPLAAADYLRLRLPAIAFEETEPIKFQIPMSMVTKIAEDAEPGDESDEPLPGMEPEPGSGIEIIDQPPPDGPPERPAVEPRPAEPINPGGGIPGVSGGDEVPETGPIMIPGLHDEEAPPDDEDVGSFEDDPALMNAREQMRQNQEEGRRGR